MYLKTLLTYVLNWVHDLELQLLHRNVKKSVKFVSFEMNSSFDHQCDKNCQIMRQLEAYYFLDTKTNYASLKLVLKLI